MTWQERRIITVLSAILAILFAAVLIVLSMRHRENLALQEQEKLTTDVGTQTEALPEVYVTSLTYYNGAATLSFSLGENGHWLWSDDENFPLNESTVLALLEELHAWAPQQTLTDAASLERAGLSQPSGSLTAITNQGTVSTLLFGNTTDDGNSYYVRLNGDETTAHIISDRLYKLMTVPIYDMCVLPEFPELGEETISSLALNGYQGTDSQLPSHIAAINVQREGDVATWRCNGYDISDNHLLQDLLADLSRLAFSKCVIYRPSDEAATICGFDTPEATATISYSTGSEDRRILLTIGNRLPDESGRYVRLNDDPSIYLLETALLDPLMHIAVVGMDPVQ